MPDIDEKVNEALEAADEKKSKLNSLIAACVAVAATFLAISNVKAGNVVQAMSKAQVEIVDTWAFFQAKSTKQSLAEVSVDQLTIAKEAAPDDKKPGYDKLIESYKAKSARYEKEKNELQTKVDGLQKEYDALNVKDDQFDISEALLSVAIALFGITALTQKRWMIFVALSFAGFGLLVGLSGFVGWNIRPEWLAKLIGA
jgi:hypothetical protein